MIEFKLNRVEENAELINEQYHLWRFLDLHKLLHFLLKKEIVFSRMDCFDDPLEGMTLLQLDHLDHVNNLPNRAIINPRLGADVIKQMLDQKKAFPALQKKYQQSQRNQFASCWYKHDNQSWAMWNQYSNNEGFAIKVNGKRLLENLTMALNLYHSKNKDVVDAMIGSIEYLPIWPFNRPAMHQHDNPGIYSGFKKDISYRHENELRLIIALNKIKRTKYIGLKLLPKMDIDFMIYANPRMESWKFENFKCLMRELNVDLQRIVKSELAFRKV